MFNLMKLRNQTQVIITSLITIFIVAAMAGATTIGTNISTDGTLSVGTSISTDGTLSVTGNATFDTNTLYVDANNNLVGIGTTTPYSRLSVWGNGSNPIFEAVNNASTTQMIILNNGNVGIGTTDPDYKFEVDNSTADADGNVFGVHSYSQNENADDYTYGVYGDAYGGDEAYGVYGYGRNANVTYGAYGDANGGDEAYGVYGYGRSANVTYGVYGYGLGINSGTSYGVYGKSAPDFGVSLSENYGVYAYATSDFGSSDTNYGVYARVTSDFGSATTNYGLYATSGSGFGSADENYGIFAQAYNDLGTVNTTYGLYSTAYGGSVENWAGYFDQGNVYIGGNLGIGTTTPTVSFQVTDTSANATTTIEIGKTGQNKGSCLKLYDAAGTTYYCSINNGSLTCTTTSCE